MTKIRITMDVDLGADGSYDLATLSHAQIALLLRDAFHEFRKARGPTSEAYVDRRYPEYRAEIARLERSDRMAMAAQVATMRATKIEEVTTRRAAAEALHHSTVTIEQIEEKP